MPVVRVKGVANPMQFPDDMDINDIREFLRRRFMSQMGESQPDLAPIESVAQEVKPSLAERAGQGISNALYDSGIISDRYGAQRIGRNLSSIGEFLPVIGDATAGDEFGRALKKGNYGDAAIAGIGSVPILGDMAIFAGVMAKNADLRLLKKAKSLEKSGAGRDEIWKETGWANDQGDWKFEISDYLDFDTGKGADINPSSFNIIKDYGGTTNENFMGHPELYDAYPNLKDRPVRSVAGSGAQYNIGTDVVSIGDKLLSPTSGVELSNTQSVNLHELQHAIQSREGFASGGNPEQFIGRYNSAPERIKDANYSAELKGLLDEGVPESEILDLYKGMPEEGFVRDLWSNQKDFIKGESVDYFNKLARVAKSDLIPPSDKYERLAGEAEARNVQARMDMTPEQRRATPPWRTLDVPEDELIYRKGGTNKAMSVGDAAKKGYRGISSANKRIDPNITWFSADEKLAKGYSDTNKAFSADLNIKRPFDAGDDKNTTTPLRLANQALSQMGADNIDKKTAMLIKADFLSNYPDPRKEVRVIDFWASDDGKDNVANLLQDLGFDAVRLKEEGVETYGMIRMKAE